MKWPREGLSAQEAINFIDDNASEGKVPIFTDSMYCYRWLQNYLPIRLIAIDNPVTPIGFVELSHLTAKVSQIIAYRNGLGCDTYAPEYNSLEDGLRQLGVFKRSLAGILNEARGRDARVLVADLPDAASVMASEVNDGAVAMVVDSIECLWGIQGSGLLRTAVITDKPAYLLAAVEPEATRLLGVGGRPVVLLADSHDGRCIARGFRHNRGSELSLRDAVRIALTLLMSNRGVINAPLEVLIKGDGHET
jgi:hypothetical protein